MAVIDQVLARLHLRSTVFSRMTLAGDWGFAKHALDGAPFHLVLSGRAHVRLPHDGGTHALGAGDIAILPRGEPHDLLAHPDAETIPWRRMMEQHDWAPWHADTRFKAVDLRHGSGEPVAQLISGVFSFDDRRPNPLLSALPSAMVMRADGSAASDALTTIAALLDEEIGSGRPGAEDVASRLADILFVQAIRRQIASADSLPQGWLRGIADPELASAIALIHHEPQKPWSVETLAHAIGMSRSRFAARFRDTVGQAPLDYLTDWRMYQAAGQLATDSTALPTIAASVGYRSDVAFGKAFRRWSGRSPAAYRRSLRQRSSDDDARDQDPMRPRNGVVQDERLGNPDVLSGARS